jgi:predicted Zn-ribbon and HTH transcriptional regulator
MQTMTDNIEKLKNDIKEKKLKYYLPELIICPKCGYAQYADPLGDLFLCPTCTQEFLKKHVPMMERKR